MSALKRKDLTIISPVDASFMPFRMTQMGTVMDLYNLPLDQLENAPLEWNFYRPLSDGKMIELIQSIQKNGLFHPVVVWEQGNDRYMILSGHNRVRAYRSLLENTGEEAYLQIGCSIRRGITPDQAREILIDSNWVARTLSVSERTRTIYEKYLFAGRKKRGSGEEGIRTYDIIAQEYGLSGRQIHRYLKLRQLIEPLMNRLDKGSLTLQAGVRLADFSKEVQEELANLPQEMLSLRMVSCLHSGMPIQEILAVLMASIPEIKESTVLVTLSVPSDLEAAFREMAEGWLVTQKNKKIDPIKKKR